MDHDAALAYVDVSFADYLRILRSHIALIVLVILISTGAAIVLTGLAAPQYQADVVVRVRPAAPGSTAIQNTLTPFQEQTDLGTEAVLVTSTPVATEVINRLNLAAQPKDVVSHITAQGIPKTAILVIFAKAAVPQEARELANAFAESYIDIRRQQAKADLQAAEHDLSRQIASTQARLNTINAQLAASRRGTPQYIELQSEQASALSDLVLYRSQVRDLANQAALASGFGEVTKPADSVTRTGAGSVVRSAIFGLLIGVPLAVAAALLLESLRRRIDTIADAEKETGADVIGVIPAARRRHKTMLPPRDPFSAFAEAYRTLRSNLDTVAKVHKARTVLVTSPVGADGKSSTVANLAYAYGDSQRWALIVDADLRRPSLHEVFGVDRAPGFAELVSGTMRAGEVTHRPFPTVGFVAAGGGGARPDHFLTGSQTKRRLSTLRTAFGRGTSKDADGDGDGDSDGGTDVRVIIDSAPILLAGEVSSLVNEVDAVILVLRAGRATKEQARKAAAQVRRAGGNLVGVVLTGVAVSSELLSESYRAYRPRVRS
ncbi:MAG: Wzz/FepE/Etk N-terminal domain-containing protein [Candidatus Dormibacteria bacterium]